MGVVWGVGVAATLTPPQRVSQEVVWVGAVVVEVVEGMVGTAWCPHSFWAVTWMVAVVSVAALGTLCSTLQTGGRD